MSRRRRIPTLPGVTRPTSCQARERYSLTLPVRLSRSQRLFCGAEELAQSRAKARNTYLAERSCRAIIPFIEQLKFFELGLIIAFLAQSPAQETRTISCLDFRLSKHRIARYTRCTLAETDECPLLIGDRTKDCVRLHGVQRQARVPALGKLFGWSISSCGKRRNEYNEKNINQSSLGSCGSVCLGTGFGDHYNNDYNRRQWHDHGVHSGEHDQC